MAITLEILESIPTSAFKSERDRLWCWGMHEASEWTLWRDRRWPNFALPRKRDCLSPLYKHSGFLVLFCWRLKHSREFTGCWKWYSYSRGMCVCVCECLCVCARNQKQKVSRRLDLETIVAQSPTDTHIHHSLSRRENIWKLYQQLHQGTTDWGFLLLLSSSNVKLSHFSLYLRNQQLQKLLKF